MLTYADNQPADYPTTQGAERFAALVKKRTGGKVVIQVKSGGEYGTEQEVWQQLSIGGIDFARLSLSVLAADLPKLNVLQLPCLYEDAAHMWRVLDGPIGEEFLRVFAERDMVGLSWYDAGARSFYSDKSLRSLEDLQGMTIRVQDANVVIDMVKLLGGDPVTLAYSDVYAAFETDKIDAAENNWPAYLAMEHYKVARYYLVDEHSRVPEIQLASGKTWAKLPRMNTAVSSGSVPGSPPGMSGNSGPSRRPPPARRYWPRAAGKFSSRTRKRNASASWFSRCMKNTPGRISNW